MLDVKEVSKRTGISRSVLYTLIQAGQFPKAIQLTKKTVRWADSDVEGWLQNKIASQLDQAL